MAPSPTWLARVRAALTQPSAPPSDHWLHRPDIWSGLVLGSALATHTFRPSLMPRTTANQALVSGVSGGIGFVLANAVYGVAAHTGNTAADLGLLAATGGGGFAVSRLLPEQDHEGDWRPIVRTVGSAAAAGAAAAAAGVAVRSAPPGQRKWVGGAVTTLAVLSGGRDVWRGVKAQRAAHDEYDPPPPKPLPALGQSFGVAAGVTTLVVGFRRSARGIGRMLDHRFGVPTGIATWLGRGLAVGVWFGTGKALGNVVASGLRLYDRVVDPGFDRAPTSSRRTAGPDSPVSFARIGREGRKFVLNVPSVEDIERVMRQPARAEPIRVFIGYAAARTDDERVALAMAELRRTEAFDRRLLVVGCAAGNGYVNTLPLEVLDLVMLGDTAAVSVQYGRLPSFLTLQRVTRGGRVQGALLAAIQAELSTRPPDRRPTVVVYGESLGAWSGQDTFLHEGIEGLDRLGVARALWTGTPYYSGWRREVVVDRTVPVPEGSVVEVEGCDALTRLSADQRDALRAVIVGHGNDPVRYISAGLLVRRPGWLAPEKAADGTTHPRPWGVPHDMGWLPAVTGVQVIVDAVNATRPVPGVFRATGHEYNADLPDATLIAYGIPYPERETWERLVDHLRSVDAERAARRKLPRPEEVGGADAADAAGVEVGGAPGAGV